MTLIALITAILSKFTNFRKLLLHARKVFFTAANALTFKLFRNIAVTRMRVEGVVTVTFNVVLKDLFKLGYDNGEKWKK